MLKIILLLFLPLSLFSSNIKIASYNVENLFDMIHNGHEYQEYIPHKHNWTDKIFKKKLLNISEVICELNADIIGLQEIENKNVLKKLQQTLTRVGCNYKYSAITHKKQSAIQVAILSRIPFKNKKELVVNRTLGYRNILEVKFSFNGNLFFVFVNHWKSKRSKESYRILSAKRLMKRLNTLPKGSEYIILGDFNSDYDEFQHLELKHNDSHGKTGINHYLKTINSQEKFIRPFLFKEKEIEHYNLWLEVENYKRWSHNFYGNKQALDAIILPSTLFNGKGLEYIKNSFDVFKKSYLFHKKGYIFRWEYKHKKHQGKGYSDHLPIVATFSTDKAFKKLNNNGLHINTIDRLLSKEILLPILLKKVKVISLEKKKAIITDRNAKKNISIYGIKNALQLNKYYDIAVYKRKFYKGQYEIIDFEIEKRYDSE